MRLLALGRGEGPVHKVRFAPIDHKEEKLRGRAVLTLVLTLLVLALVVILAYFILGGGG